MGRNRSGPRPQESALDREQRRSDALLSRPRLEALLDEAASRRLTALTGGAGVGKTTLLMQWLGRRPAAWHTVTPGDVSLSVLARGILDKLRLQVPDLSADMFLAIEGGREPETEAGESDRADSLAAELCRDLEARLSRDLYLVLDDVHLLGRSGDGVRLVAALSRNAPERLHLITASRDPLPFPTSRMRIQKQAGEITADQMAFTVEEVGLLLQATGEDSPETAAAIFDRTGGWPVAVVLAMQLQHLDGDDAASTDTDNTTLFDYLAEEVIGSEPAEALIALRAAAVLPWVTPEMAALLQIDDEAALLFDPQRRSIYVTPAPNNPHAVSISPLVRDFLLEHHLLDPEREEALLRAASAHYEQEGAIPEGMECLLALGSSEELARFVAERGEAMLAAGMARRMPPRATRRWLRDRARSRPGWPGVSVFSATCGAMSRPLSTCTAEVGVERETSPARPPCSAGRQVRIGFVVSGTRRRAWPTRPCSWHARPMTPAPWPPPTPSSPWWLPSMGTGPGTTSIT